MYTFVEVGMELLYQLQHTFWFFVELFPAQADDDLLHFLACAMLSKPMPFPLFLACLEWFLYIVSLPGPRQMSSEQVMETLCL